MPQRHPDTGEFLGSDRDMSLACFESPRARLERHFWANPVLITLTTDEQRFNTFTLPAEEVSDQFGEKTLPELTFRMDEVAAASLAVHRRRQAMHREGVVV